MERLEIPYPVIGDSERAIWADYGCHGWPSLFLWSKGGALRWYHFGEGEYAATEEAIQDELELGVIEGRPAPVEPLRPGDAPGAFVVPPSPELLPGGSEAEPWRASGEQPASRSTTRAPRRIRDARRLRVWSRSRSTASRLPRSQSSTPASTAHPEGRHGAHRLELRPDPRGRGLLGQLRGRPAGRS